MGRQSGPNKYRVPVGPSTGALLRSSGVGRRGQAAELERLYPATAALPSDNPAASLTCPEPDLLDAGATP